MRRVALLVVHGIGSQKCGETLANCAAGLQCAYPNAALLDRNGASITPLEISTNKLDEAILRQPSWQVHLYEVYWAQTLAGHDVEASFNKFLFEETTWFPWFNWKCGLLPRCQYSRLLIWARTAQMWLVALAATIIYEIVPKGLHGTVLDQVVADVWNYTHSLGGSLQERSPIHGAGRAIVDRLRQTVRRAHQDGCEELQIIAHSLGTVVAYNALTRYPSPAPNEAPMPITCFYTIGSPLEKFLFIWTRLLRPSLPNPEIQIDGVAIASGPTIRWKNFHSPLDLVSGKLKRFPEWGQVENERVWGLGGLARAHGGYFQSPVVIAELAAGLGGHPQAVKIPLARRTLSAMVGIGENLIVPGLVVLALLVGLALFLFVGALLGALLATLVYAVWGWFVNLVLGYFGIHISFVSAVTWSSIVCAVWVVVGLVLFTTKDGYRRARDAHRKFWQ